MQNKRYYNFLIFACVFLWCMMMGSKNVYTAEISVLYEIFEVSESDATLAMTYYFFTYSTAQIVMFFFMDEINVKWFLSVSIALSGIVTVVVGLMTEMWQMWWILALNGILQAGVWGMCIAVFKKYLPSDMLAKANSLMNVGTAIAGVISYGFASFFVEIGMWNAPYFILGAILSLSAIIFFIALNLAEKHITIINADKEVGVTADNSIFNFSSGLKKLLFFLFAFAFSVLVHSTFYMGMNWLPLMLEETHALKNSLSILISVLAPIATIIGAVLAIKQCEKHNLLLVALIYLGLSVILSFAMMTLFDFNVIIITLLTVSFLVLNQGLISITFGVLPLKVESSISAGGLGSLMNAAGGYSAGFAPLIASFIFRDIGWSAYYLLIFIITALLFVSILTLYALSKKRLRNKKI